MPQLQQTVLLDRRSTPVSHTFNPRDITGGIGTVIESAGVPIGNNRLSVGLSQVAASGRYKATVKLAMPVVQTQTINGVDTPVVVRTAYADLQFTYESASSTQERDDIVALLRAALDPTKALINDVVVNLQGVY